MHRVLRHCYRLILSVALIALLPAHPSFAARLSYFNMEAKRSENLVPFPKWTGVMTRYGEEKEVPDSECGQRKYHPCVIKEWQAMIEEARKKPLRDQLNTVNDWGNAHPYIVDQLNWGMEDYWETPYEFMEVNGDCEDYAIAKYYSLRAIGYPEDKLRIIIVQDFNLGGIIHAVLGVYDDDGQMLILDNQIQQIMPALKIYHYRPIYGVNEDWWWAYYPKT